MHIKSAFALALLCVSTAAIAQDDDGPHYNAGLRGSLAFEGSINAHDNLTPPDSTKVDLNVGGGASAFWGIGLPSGFDAELEMLYRYVPLGDGVVNGASAKLGGYAEMFAPMVNLYWTAPVDFPVKPYIGGGLGYAWNEVGLNSIGGTAIQAIHDDGWRFAYNAMVGVVIPTNETSRFTIGYRWLHEDIGINCGAGIACSGNMNSQSFDIGMVFDL
ncbi:MAG TPA: outer membrane beta-barrel protein [Verrucomicrobiae bacterium]|nr:outer membrane beta-barrel protein [Verrucomicrobiae bacterium]